MFDAYVLRQTPFEFLILISQNVLAMLEHRGDTGVHRGLNASVLRFQIDELHYVPVRSVASLTRADVSIKSNLQSLADRHAPAFDRLRYSLAHPLAHCRARPRVLLPNAIRCDDVRFVFPAPTKGRHSLPAFCQR